MNKEIIKLVNKSFWDTKDLQRYLELSGKPSSVQKCRNLKRTLNLKKNCYMPYCFSTDEFFEKLGTSRLHELEVLKKGE